MKYSSTSHPASRGRPAGRLIRGPWQAPPPRLEGRAFETLPPARQEQVLRFALHDLARYRSDLTDNERAWLHGQIPPAVLEGQAFETLTPDQRFRIAGALLLVLRRRAGWAA
jgi:hypothetical protein